MNKYPELSEEGAKEAQNLMNKFEADLKESAIEVIKGITETFYTDVLPHIESDNWVNYKNNIMESVFSYSDNYDSEKRKIRTKIYAENKEEINEDLNKDLLNQNTQLKQTLDNMFN